MELSFVAYTRADGVTEMYKYNRYRLNKRIHNSYM